MISLHDSSRPTLLITGATGFLGVPCVDRAREEGYAVHCLARTRRYHRDVEFHPIDLFDYARVSETLADIRPRDLLHLAWIATPGVYVTSPENRAWIEASRHLLRAFVESGGERAVIAGSCMEYDWSSGGVCREFDTPTRPSTVYGQCKNELREWVDEFASRSGFSVAWARLFFMFGPHEYPARLIPSVARALLAGQPAECSLGTQERDFLHTHDIADALISLLGSRVSGPVNIGAGTAVSIRQLVEWTAQLCGRPELVKFGARPLPAHELPLIVADVHRLRHQLGWQPRYSLEDRLKETVAWWKERRAA